MSDFSRVRAAIGSFSDVRSSESGIIVPTMTLLPGGDAISVIVTPSGGDHFRVSDNGAARAAILDAGMFRLTAVDRRRALELAEEAGLATEGDAFVATDIRIDQIVAAVASVAELSRAWASYVVERARRLREQQLAERVGERLERAFSPAHVCREVVVLGASNTQHRFDFLVELTPSVRAVVEVVSPVPQSLAFAHMKFSDVRRGHEDWLREAVVQKVEGWNAEHLSLLGQAASHIRDVNSDWGDLRRSFH